MVVVEIVVVVVMMTVVFFKTFSRRGSGCGGHCSGGSYVSERDGSGGGGRGQLGFEKCNLKLSAQARALRQKPCPNCKHHLSKR